MGLLRKVGSGRPRLLEHLTMAELVNIVLKPAISFGYETDLWTIGRLHRVIQEGSSCPVVGENIRAITYFRSWAVCR